MPTRGRLAMTWLMTSLRPPDGRPAGVPGGSNLAPACRGLRHDPGQDPGRRRRARFRAVADATLPPAALADEPDIDLILLDINMPVMDGLTLLARLREKQMPVKAIIVSAYGDMTNLRTAMNRGAFDFVTKPVDLNDLEITIRKTLDDIGRLREIERLRAAAERARNNLSRYFSPNLVDMLAERDEPLGAVRRQTVA